jgi:trimeric autotransporter adhesin
MENASAPPRGGAAAAARARVLAEASGAAANAAPPPAPSTKVSLSGEDLAELLVPLGAAAAASSSSASVASGASSLDSSSVGGFSFETARKALQTESRHEVVALHRAPAGWQMTVNWENWGR